MSERKPHPIHARVYIAVTGVLLFIGSIFVPAELDALKHFLVTGGGVIAGAAVGNWINSSLDARRVRKREARR